MKHLISSLGFAGVLFAGSVSNAQTVCPVGDVVCGTGCMPSSSVCNQAGSFYCPNGDDATTLVNACLSGTVEIPAESVHPVITAYSVPPLGYTACGTGYMPIGFHCCAYTGNDAFCSSATVCTTDSHCEEPASPVVPVSTGVGYLDGGFSPVDSGTPGVDGGVAPVDGGTTDLTFCPSGTIGYEGGCMPSNAVPGNGHNYCAPTTHASANIGYCYTSAFSSHTISGTVACSVSNDHCFDGIGDHGIGYACTTDTYGVSFCALVPPPFVDAGQTVVTTIDGGVVTTYVDGGAVVSTIDGGTVVNTIDGGQVVSTVDGGTVVNYIDGGVVVDHIDGGTTSASASSSGCQDVGGDYTFGWLLLAFMLGLIGIRAVKSYRETR